jgi:type I restriction enzyme S subunit
MIPVPPFQQQQRIADILSAYDDVIENNRRRIALLEGAARMLYREWFVHFRFPGHEHIKIIDGIPEGWERRRLGDLLVLKRGYDLPETRRVQGPIPVVSSSGITGRHNEKKANGPGIVTGRYGTIGEVYLIEEDFWPLNTALYVLDKKNNPPLFLLHILRQTLVAIQSDKAAIPGVNRNVLHENKVIAPPVRLRILFSDMVEDNYSMARILREMNSRLAEARDLLLPRLMNGDIAV